MWASVVPLLSAELREVVVHTLKDRSCWPCFADRELELREVHIIFISPGFETVLLTAFRNPSIYPRALAFFILSVPFPHGGGWFRARPSSGNLRLRPL